MAASLAASDSFGIRGRPFPVRLVIGLPGPKKDHVAGLDFAGVAESVGDDVSQFEPGDEVFGECRGPCARYAVARVGGIERKPPSSTFAQAAAMPTSACTGLQGLRDHGRVRAGQRVLINGASGGVGTFAVQIGQTLGAEVTAVCSTGNVDTVRALGADHVIDDTREDFTQGGPRYDVIMDNVASHSLSDTRRALTSHGVHIPSSDQPGIGWIIGAALTALVVRQQGKPFVASTAGEDLLALDEMIAAGTVTPVIDQTYSLSEAREAFRYVDGGHARGKVVVEVEREIA